MSSFFVGDHVTHTMFGDGAVTEVQETKLQIAFQKFGTKLVRNRFVKRRP